MLLALRLSNSSSALAVTLKFEGVARLPVSTTRTTNELVSTVSGLAKSAVVAPSRSQTPLFAVLVHRVANPVDARIFTNGGVLRINQNHLVVFVCLILVHPVRVKNAKVAALAANALLSDSAQVTSSLLLVDTLVLGLTIDNALGVGALATTTAHTNAEDNIALLSLVSKAVGFFRAERAINTVHLGELTVFPGCERREFGDHGNTGDGVPLLRIQVDVPRTRSKKRITSDCFLRQSSSIYL